MIAALVVCLLGCVLAAGLCSDHGYEDTACACVACAIACFVLICMLGAGRC